VNDKEEIIAYRSLLNMVLLWRNMDGDGITDPLRADIKQTLDHFKRQDMRGGDNRAEGENRQQQVGEKSFS